MTADKLRDQARQIPGEPALSRGEPVDIAAALGALQARSTPELRTEWRRLYRARPPRRLSRDLLLRAVAHRLQERVHGGLALATRRRLDALAEEFVAKGAAQFDPGMSLKPGTRLVREWHGRAHAVIVLEDGFEYDGQRYRSLTRIASLITGVHWSGPVFFGLKKRPQAREQASP
jgi:hypothetical protein